MFGIEKSGFKRILVVGDSGRGKTTLAEKLSRKLKIKHYSTDDFFWKVKFTEAVDKATSIKEIAKVYSQESWIVEGSTRSLIEEGIQRADYIIYLGYPSLFSQFWTLFKRKLTRKEERWKDLFGLYHHLFCKRYKIGSQKNKMGLDEMLIPFNKKVVRLFSYNEIDELLEKI